MVGGSSGRGDDRGKCPLGRGFEDGHGGDVRGTRSLVREVEDGRGRRPIGRGRGDGFGRGDGQRARPVSLGFGDNFGRRDGQRGRPDGLGFGDGHGRGNGHGGRTNSSSSAPPSTMPRAPIADASSPTALADNESPESPPTPVAGSSLGNQVATSSENASSSNSKPLLKIVYKFFSPSHVASGQITKCIKQRFDKEGYTWLAISQQTKEFYWNEFLVVPCFCLDSIEILACSFGRPTLFKNPFCVAKSGNCSMETGKEWVYMPRNSHEYRKGVKKLIQSSLSSSSLNGKIKW